MRKIKFKKATLLILFEIFQNGLICKVLVKIFFFFFFFFGLDNLSGSIFGQGPLQKAFGNDTLYFFLISFF